MSSHTNKIGFFCTCIFVGVLCVNSLWAEEKAAPPPDPYADAQILVEAFVVEVGTAGLREVGANPIGEGPGGITVAKLGACLVSDEGARVISGAKVAARHRQSGKSQESKRCYLKQVTKNIVIPQKGGQAVETLNTTFRDYNFGKRLEVAPRIVSDTAISTEYSYSEGGILTDPKNYDPNNFSPPDTYDYSWNGVICLSPGKPVIAGAMQNRDSVIFLILTATVQDMPEMKQKEPNTAVPSN